jgi:hypothetical protein
MNTIPISVDYQGMLLTGHADPLENFKDSLPSRLIIYIQGWCLGTLSYCNNKWSMDKPIDPLFIESLGNYISSYMRSLKKEGHL